MSFDLVDIALSVEYPVTGKGKIDSIGRFVLVYIAKAANNSTKECWVSQSTMARKIGTTRQSVNERIKILSDDGIIEKSERWVKTEKGNLKQSSSTYKVNVNALVSKLPKDELDKMKRIVDGALGVGVEPCDLESHPLSGQPTPPVGSADTPCRVSRHKSVSLISKESSKGKCRFTPPTLEEIFSYMKEKDFPYQDEAERYFNYYESNGWMVGKNKMKKWKNSVSMWISRSDRPKRTSPKAVSNQEAAIAKQGSDDRLRDEILENMERFA